MPAHVDANATFCVAAKPTKPANTRASQEPLSKAKTPRLAMAAPITMPGASSLTMSQRTAPRLWWARTLESDVKMMVAIEVAIAILTARSGDTPRPLRMMVRKGTMIMPPPMPSRPARKPVPRPSRASSRINRGSSIMEWGALDAHEPTLLAVQGSPGTEERVQEEKGSFTYRREGEPRSGAGGVKAA